MIKTITLSARLLGLALMCAFVFQTVVVQAEHVGLIECASDDGKSNVPQQDSSQPGDECCTHAEAIAQEHPALSWNSPVLLSFDVCNDVLPDGPTAAIYQPPRVA